MLNAIENEETQFEQFEPLDDEVIEESAEPVRLYDAESEQIIYLQIERGEKLYNVSWQINPLPDADFFNLQDALVTNAKKLKTLSVGLLSPLAEAGKKLALSRTGYKERIDWREAAHPNDFTSVVQLYLKVTAKTEAIETSELLDDDAETPVTLISTFNGFEIKTKIYFKEESQAQMDEYLAALNNEPSKNALASAKKISKERRLYALYEQLRTRDEGYLNRVPAWHAIEALAGFLNSQLQRLGKLPQV